MNIEMENALHRIKMGDGEAFRELLEQFRPMIYSFFKNYYLEEGAYAISREDLFQEGCLALLEAAKRYESNRGAHFSTFAYVVIRRRIGRCLRKEYRKYGKEHYSIDTLEEPDYYPLLGQNVQRVQREKQAEHGRQKRLQQIREYVVSLNAEDREIVAYRSQKKSYAEIASLLGIKPKRVDNRLQYLKRDFQQRYCQKEMRES